jgi:hypothetical protein
LSDPTLCSGHVNTSGDTSRTACFQKRASRVRRLNTTADLLPVRPYPVYILWVNGFLARLAPGGRARSRADDCARGLARLEVAALRS